jgi:integrase
MAKYERLTRANMLALPVGASIFENGIKYTRLKGDGRFAVNLMVDGQRIQRVIGKESEGVTRTQAEEFIAQARTHAREQRLSLPKGRKLAMSFTEAANQYLDRLQVSDGKNLNKKEQHLRNHLKPFFGSIALASLTETEIGRYKAARKTSGAAIGTINRELATLSHLLNCSLDWGWITIKPRKIGLLKGENQRLIALTPKECAKLLKEARLLDPQLYLFCRMGLSTGMRCMEILSARIEHIHLQERRLFIWKSKTGPGFQEIPSGLAEYLRWYLKSYCSEGQEWLFPSKLGTKVGYRTSIDDAFRTACKNAGLSEDITPHVMRHTVGTILTNEGKPAKQVMEYMRHKTHEMYLRYSHITDETRKETADLLEATIQKEALRGSA